VVANRRFGPLVLLVGLGLIGLVARLFQVQVGEHEVWAREAANLTRSERTIPYLRGRILDRNGQEFVRDEEAYAVRFVYREFRRHHPLGQVAHARSALEGRHAGLPLAALELEEWGMALAESRAGELERFARGEAAHLCGVEFPAVTQGTDRRHSRAGEVRYYVRGLLRASRRAWSAIRKGLRKGRGWDSSWIELVAEREELPVEFVRERLQARLRRSLERLGQLAVQLEVRSLDGLIAVTEEESLWFLIDALEVQRRAIEDAIAHDLFLEAAGFEVGRIEPELLLELIDLEFIVTTLGWSHGRCREWVRTARESWLENRRTFHVPRAQVGARMREDQGEDGLEALLGELAMLYQRRPRTSREARGRSRQWRGVEDLAVFAELGNLFEELEGPGLQVPTPLPFVVRELRGAGPAELSSGDLAQAMVPFEFAPQIARERPPQPHVDWRGIERDPWRAPESAVEASDRLVALLYPQVEPSSASYGLAVRDGEELVPWLESLWEAQSRSSLGQVAEGIRAAASAVGVTLPLTLDTERLERAEKKADYFIRDRGSRPAQLEGAPDDDVVNTLTRFVDEYRGFQIDPRTRRLAMAMDADGVLVARELIGVVRESTLEEVLEQQGIRNVFREILRQAPAGGEDEARKEVQLNALLDVLYRVDEVRGTSGVEGLMDDVLRGRNGFEANEGLQQREEGTRGRVNLAKEDGRDVELTLSVELQTAAQNTIEHPVLPLREDNRDEYWFANPVGAIVLATVEGEILAAASCPKQPHEPSPARDGERAYNYERTLRMPLFQPPGSIFKPFVAAYALSRRGLEPSVIFNCQPRDSSGTAGWGKVACHNTWGHGSLDLVNAIEHSCNAYFAQVGELLVSKDNLRELAHIFGFDRPTGVRDVGRGRGLVEAWRIPSLHGDHERREFSATDLHRAGNGLAVVEATPVQVARAVAGLATGRLPGMRLVRRIDGELVEPTYEDIPLPGTALEVVRRAMAGVVIRGSAHEKGLSADELGFTLAGKTGSADYREMTSAYLRELRLPPGRRPEMRKHTWFMGFFPVEAPRAVVVVYCHDIGVTSSHSATYVAAQFLKSPEVQAFAQGAIR
jgi:cell division protein FtsI/penicillin-binding protein 2